MSSSLRDGEPAPPPLLLDPLLGYLNTRRKDGDDGESPPSPPDGRIDVDAAVSDLTTRGYHVVRSVLTEDECDAALGRLWDFVEDVSGGCVARSDPRSWYPLHQCRTADDRPVELRAGEEEDEDSRPIICRDPDVEGGDVDPWPHTGYGSFPDMFQSLGAGLVLGDVREILAERVYGPLFGTDDLASSKEGFTFCRPLVVEDDGGRGLVWDPYGESREANGSNRRRPLFRVCGRDQPSSGSGATAKLLSSAHSS
ncbi:hypothetical protein THAOC_34734 [Thalassiosira oceanica]|uniref:Uncharacterized protein n=1 Tax=Thalassiosira oceanica TaxID=159749 RepID=K0R218_THAOC|nr:hypothetical protein THAOC_34734 [Thalassiosira oceanica]|eukprot:EJK46593.1 hypothetical protein THAOC_34734 [Thalassiosira oceanica]